MKDLEVVCGHTPPVHVVWQAGRWHTISDMARPSRAGVGQLCPMLSRGLNEGSRFTEAAFASCWSNKRAKNPIDPAMYTKQASPPSHFSALTLAHGDSGPVKTQRAAHPQVAVAAW
ncbi:hypothetical protein P3342_001608 [Pyrenophora teres f. teres]|nr:hypothetical protein P3342_001608 [Pyrenophora teres f. teres]